MSDLMNEMKKHIDNVDKVIENKNKPSFLKWFFSTRMGKHIGGDTAPILFFMGGAGSLFPLALVGSSENIYFIAPVYIACIVIYALGLGFLGHKHDKYITLKEEDTVGVLNQLKYIFNDEKINIKTLEKIIDNLDDLPKDWWQKMQRKIDKYKINKINISNKEQLKQIKNTVKGETTQDLLISVKKMEGDS